MTTKRSHVWYIRRNGDVRGPFPTKAISQFLLLGRITKNDEISRDQEEWMKISNVVELHAEVKKAEMAEEADRLRLEAAKRGADERGVHDRRKDDDSEHAEQRKGERRAPESEEMVVHRKNRVSERLEQVEQKAKQQNKILAVILFVICGGLLSLFFVYQPEDDIAEIDCRAEPAAGINWSNCNFQGAGLDGVNLSKGHIRNANLSNASLFRATLEGTDLSYANLGLANLRMSSMSGANLTGATLRGADLRGADLFGVDFSYADLQGAQLAGASLEGAKFDKAIWVNGELCGLGSLGGCSPAAASQ